MTTAYTIKKRLGKEMVFYACAGCSEPLESLLTEAGQKDDCPKCRLGFVVPGADEVERRAAQARADEQKHREEEQKKAKALEYERAKATATAKERARMVAAATEAAERAYVPNYPALSTVASMLVGFAYFSYVAGALAIIFLVVSISAKDENIPAGISLISFAGGAFVSGLMLHAIGELCRAIRDIAINSFKALQARPAQ
jgi:DNA-directed RNA polymerase subunit RPC12/RpoP